MCIIVVVVMSFHWIARVRTIKKKSTVESTLDNTRSEITDVEAPQDLLPSYSEITS